MPRDYYQLICSGSGNIYLVENGELTPKRIKANDHHWKMITWRMAMHVLKLVLEIHLQYGWLSYFI